jgi:hypothetical protein
MEFHIPSLKDILTNGLKPEASARLEKIEKLQNQILPLRLKIF